MAKKRQVTYVEVEDRNPFGDENVTETDMQDPTHDIFYIPGYSDKRQQYEAMRKEGYDPPPLPFRLQWARAQTASGNADGSKIAEWKSQKYQKLSWDEAKALDLDIGATAAHKAEDGSIMIGDVVLMIADKEAAATNYKQWKERNVEQEEAVLAQLHDSAEAVNQKMGYDAVKGTEFETEVEIPATGKKRTRKA